MTFALAQSFPLGRFHATPWKVFPYDDPYGEWPPSPWRLLRALLARSHQLERERDPGEVTDKHRAALVRAFAASNIAWRLPEFSWRGSGLRQYHPAEFKRMPAAAREPGMMTYNTTKAQDNFWLTSGDREPLHWIFEGDGWDTSTLALLDACLERLTYFGRAESITVIKRHESFVPLPNCRLHVNRPSGRAVPVLCPDDRATLDQLHMTTDDPPVRNSTVPPGAVWRYAERPERQSAKPKAARSRPTKSPMDFMQFAIGSRVPPSVDHVALLTNRFRGAAVNAFLRSNFGLDGGWQKADSSQRDAVALLSGKGADGEPLQGHQHARFAIWFDPETNKPARLVAWRGTPFDDAEQNALLSAAARSLSMGYNSARDKAHSRDPWTIHLVPLDSAVPRPAGFDRRVSYSVWESMTPYIPPRHVYDRRGQMKAGEEPEAQVIEELRRLEIAAPRIETLDHGRWVKVHSPKRDAGKASNLSKRGFRFRLTFAEPISGPISLGHSAHFGLGLFAPAECYPAELPP